jgi:hypothetical protein
MRAQLTLEAKTDGAVQGLRSARQEVQELSRASDEAAGSTERMSQSFRGLKRTAPDAGAGMSMIEQGATGAARAFGLSASQARILQIAIRTLSGALGPVTIALGVLATAIAVVQRRKEQAEERARLLEESQLAAADAAREHARQLAEEQEQLERTEQAFFDLRLQVLDYIDAEEALATRQRRIAQLSEELGEARIETMEDAREALDRLTDAHADESRRLDEVRADREALNRVLETDIDLRREDRMRIEIGITALIREEQAIQASIAAREQQIATLRRMVPLLRTVTEVTEESTVARRARTRAIRDETDATEALLAKIKEEAELVAAAEQLKADNRAFHAQESKQLLLDQVEEELRLLQEAADAEFELRTDLKLKREDLEREEMRERDRLRQEDLQREEDAQRQRERMAVAAADRLASALTTLANRSFRDAVGAIGGQLQAEGIQRTLQGLALSALGNPQGPALAGIGAGMTTAGTAMRAAAGGGGGSAVAAGTVSPSSSGTVVNQNADVNVNVQEGVDPQTTAVRVAGALEDVFQRGLWPGGAA